MSDPQRAGAVLWLLVFVGLADSMDQDPCNCTILSKETDWELLRSNHCCLNISLSIGTMDWNLFTPLSSLRVLDLSNSGLMEITDSEGGRNQTLIEYLYLNDNDLTTLPDGFLSNAPNLRVLHLESNQLQQLPLDFLRVSDDIQELHLGYNNLKLFPFDILKPSLTTFSFLNNSLDCSCALYDQLEPAFHATGAKPLLDEVICASPNSVDGLKLIEVERGRICRSHSLTVALICIPLVVILILTCWYICCRRQKGNYTNAGRECSLATVDRNGAGSLGHYHQYEPRQKFQKDRREPEANQFKDPILLKPSSALLGSSRDLYEEVEIKLGTSADSLVEGDGQLGREGPGLMLAVEEEEEEEVEDELKADGLEVETVSVTEVMKDSTDREKLYLNQATDYYSLVPGIELEDSDHCDYETVDLS